MHSRDMCARVHRASTRLSFEPQRRTRSRMSMRAVEADESDEALAASFLAGDQRAAREIVRRHADGIGRFLLSFGAERADLDDLVQETLVRALRGIESWRRSASLQ